MIYNWFKIFNLSEFNSLNLISKTYTLILQDIGEKDILVTKGNRTSILYDGVYLSLDLNLRNPFKFESHAIYKDLSNNIYLGILVV